MQRGGRGGGEEEGKKIKSFVIYKLNTKFAKQISCYIQFYLQ